MAVLKHKPKIPFSFSDSRSLGWSTSEYCYRKGATAPRKCW
jgi:hypothetical protein